MTTNLALDNLWLARELILLKARTAIIHQETGLSPTLIRKEYKKIHKKSALQGQQKTSPACLLKKIGYLKQATLLVYLYRLEMDDNTTPLLALIASFKRYLALINNIGRPIIDFPTAYAIANWLNAGEIKMVKCGGCGSAKLIIREAHNDCPVCRR
jgi:hypothetical protein